MPASIYSGRDEFKKKILAVLKNRMDLLLTMYRMAIPYRKQKMYSEWSAMFSVIRCKTKLLNDIFSALHCE